VPASVGLLSSLASLRLADNRLEEGGVPWDALAQLRGLTLLTLDRNALTRLPHALGGCSGLVRLSASGNALAAVEEGALTGLAALRELDLAENALTALPADIGGCGCSDSPPVGQLRDCTSANALHPDCEGICYTCAVYNWARCSGAN
jgi:Leucine-rich repeat (LRR) protein